MDFSKIKTEDLIEIYDEINKFLRLLNDEKQDNMKSEGES